MSCLFNFSPNNILVISAIDENVDFAGGVVVEKNSALDAFAEKEVARFREEFFFFAISLHK
jgi:ammonia channel protein AmtB